MGGVANKNDRKFLGFPPRELVERGRGASVIRQNPADFVRNTFELRPIPIPISFFGGVYCTWSQEFNATSLVNASKGFS